jgi:hypothetical protein
MRALANGGRPYWDAPLRTLRWRPEKVSGFYLYLWSRVLAVRRTSVSRPSRVVRSTFPPYVASDATPGSRR